MGGMGGLGEDEDDYAGAAFGRRGAPAAPQRVEVPLTLSLEELFSGGDPGVRGLAGVGVETRGGGGAGRQA